jgi:UDP-N-acetylmuramate--alanine ligase
MDLEKIKKIYFIGIEGAGTSALARIFKFMGKDVSGSDEGDHFYHEILAKEGIKVIHKFSEKNISPDTDLIIYSTAFNPDGNRELAEALRGKIEILPYAEALGKIFNSGAGIAVCGTHGKTTTAAWLGYALKYSGADPTVLVGSEVFQFGGNSLAGKSEYFVLEADEYQNKLQYYKPLAAILTSADWDHPDFFPSFKEYKKVFSDFVARIPQHGFLIVWGDSSDTLEVAKNAKCEVIKYGFQEDNDLKITNYKLQITNKLQNYNDQNSKPFQIFEVIYKNKSLGEFKTQLIGKHNVLNEAAVIAVCHKLNLNIERVRKSISSFQGTARRFEYIGKRNGAILIDDYAHHPEEIQATLKAAREIYPEKNIITVFHPHTYTRTKALLLEFSQSFNDSDKVIVIDIYGSARETQGGVSSKDLVDLINKYDHDKAEYIPAIGEVIEYLKDKIGDKDVVISMGAGDVWRVSDKLKKAEQ